MKIDEPLLGTRCEVSVTAPSPAIADLAEGAVFDEVRRLESIFTVFDESSALHDLRRTGTSTVEELKSVVALGLDWHRRTAGAFHPAMQPLVDLWEMSAASGSVPDAESVALVVDRLSLSVSGHVGANGLNLDGLNANGLNLNAIAKGWIADRSLDAADIGSSAASGWLSLGGDVVHRGEASVVVGIEDPNRPYDNVAPLATVEISNEALATSGGGRRWWKIGGVRYSKVLDPRTGRPTDHVLSATVIAPTAAAADVLATTCTIVDADEALLLTASEGFECFLVCADGATVASSDRFRQA